MKIQVMKRPVVKSPAVKSQGATWTLALLIAAAFVLSVNAQSIGTLSPSIADAGQALPLTISGDGFVHCVQEQCYSYCSNTISSPYLSRGGSTITPDSFSVISTSSARCYLRIPANASAGSWTFSASPAQSSFSIRDACDSLIDAITPVSATAGWVVTMDINALHAHFIYVQGSGTSRNISAVTLSRNGVVVPADSFRISTCTSCKAYFTLPDSLPGGHYDVTVQQTAGRPTVTLPGGFLIRGRSQLLKIDPDSAARGETLSVKIFGHRSCFTLGIPETNNVSGVVLRNDSQFIYFGKGFVPESDSIFDAVLPIPATAREGVLSLLVNKGQGYPTDSLPGCFRITSSTRYLPGFRIAGTDSLRCSRSNQVVIHSRNAHFLGFGPITPNGDSMVSNVDSVTAFTDSLSLPADSFTVNSDTQLTASFTPGSKLLDRKISLRVALKNEAPLVEQNCLQVVAPTAVVPASARTNHAVAVRVRKGSATGFAADLSLPPGTKGLRARLFTVKGELVRSWSFSGLRAGRVTLRCGAVCRGLLLLRVEADGKVSQFPVIVQ